MKYTKDKYDRVQLRISPEDKQKLITLAEVHGMTLSAYIIFVALKGV